mgnify:CR=1 FL=1
MAQAAAQQLREVGINCTVEVPAKVDFKNRLPVDCAAHSGNQIPVLRPIGVPKIEENSPVVGGAFLDYMTMAVLPRHLLEGEDMQESDFFRSPVGTGPYRLAIKSRFSVQ